MEKYTMFLDWKNQCSENEQFIDSTQSLFKLQTVFFTELGQFQNLYGNTNDPK